MEFVTSSILLSGNRDSATRNVTYGRKSPTQNATLSTLLFLFHPRAFAGAPERMTENKQSADRWWADPISHSLAPLARGAPGFCVGKRGELLGRQIKKMHPRMGD